MSLLFTIKELQFRLGGFLYSENQWRSRGLSVFDPGIGIQGFAVDSRLVKNTDMFFPLKGERADGHAFLPDVVRSGCRVILVDKQYYRRNAILMKRLFEENPIVVFPVANVLSALHVLARLVLGRRQLLKIGITGSNGKTTTKELIASILKCHKPTFMTPGNYNSVIGIPLVVPAIRDEHQYGIFEMAMSEKGEMKKLADLVFPDVGLLTGIGTAHIGNIGSQLGIAQEKFEIFRNFLPSSTALFPESDPYVRRLEPKVRGRKVIFGPNSTPGFGGVIAQGIGWQDFTWMGKPVRLHLSGEHNLMNALGAISLAQTLEIDEESIRTGLESYKPIFGRGEVLRGRVTVYSDCYNANPESMAAAIRNFSGQDGSGRTVFILGDMKELGRFSQKEHEDLGRIIAEKNPDLTLLFGPEMQWTFKSAGSVLPENRLFWTDDWSDFVELVQQSVEQDDVVLLKGSRSLELERLHGILSQVQEAKKC